MIADTILPAATEVDDRRREADRTMTLGVSD